MLSVSPNFDLQKFRNSIFIIRMIFLKKIPEGTSKRKEGLKILSSINIKTFFLE